MAVFLTFLHIITHPLATPIWGVISAILLQLFNAWRERSKNRIESRKVDVTESQGDRQQNREDFQVLTDALRKELDRVREVQAETTKQLEESNEETKKCEQRYFELATQYRELLKYCATLARQVRELEGKLQAHVSREKKLSNDKKRTNQETTGSSRD